MALRVAFAPEDFPKDLLEGEEIQLSVLYFISSFSLLLLNKIIQGRRKSCRRKRIPELQNNSPGKDEEKIISNSTEERDVKISALAKITAMEDEQNSYKRRLLELKTALDSIKKNIEISRAKEAAKEGQINDLQKQVLEIAKTKTSVEEKNNFLLSEIKKYREENGRLQDRVTELGTAVRCLDDDLQSKDVLLGELTQRFRELTERQHQPLQVLQNGKAVFVHQSENGKPESGVHENVIRLNAAAELNTPPNSIAKIGTPKRITERLSPNHVPEKPGL